jgi:hypothetical protein
MDEDGNIFELTRIPMGHRASPEYFQLLLSVLAGLPSYVKAECKHPYKVQVDIWLDNARATGASRDVVEYFQWIWMAIKDTVSVLYCVWFRPSLPNSCLWGPIGAGMNPGLAHPGDWL